MTNRKRTLADQVKKFTKLPLHFVENVMPGLKPTEVAVMIWLIHKLLYTEGGSAKLSLTEIARGAGVSRSSTCRALIRLEKAGTVKRQECRDGSKWGKTTYTLRLDQVTGHAE